ncbi:MAG: DUF4390 domain-containing protein [Myxococcales bacterium]|nr:DUF4390 domain-containing protein [Myxococcales bacterium]
MNTRRCLATVALVAALLDVAGHASADVITRVSRMKFVETPPTMRVNGDVTSIFDGRTYAELDSGLPTTVVIRYALYRDRDDKVVATGVLKRRIVYDLWDEVYVLQFDAAGGGFAVRVKSKAEALRRMVTLENLPVGPLAAIEYTDHHHVVFVVELNPVSAEALAEVRRWLRQGASASFLSVFINHDLADAERVLRVRTRPFYRVRR